MKCLQITQSESNIIMRLLVFLCQSFPLEYEACALRSHHCDQNYAENLSVLNIFHNTFVCLNRFYHLFYTPETFTDKAWSKSKGKPKCDIVVI